MKKQLVVRLCFGLFGASLLALGCQSQPRATPTPLEIPTEGVVVVVVTATAQPTLALKETIEPSITPLPTLTPLGGIGTGTPVRTASPTPRRTGTIATNTPRITRTVGAPTTGTPGAARTGTPAATVAAFKYAAPVAMGPARPNTFKDGNAIKFRFGAVAPLGGNECYLVRVEMTNPKVVAGQATWGDDFLYPQDPSESHCGDQSASGMPLAFTLYPGRGFANLPNYGTILAYAEGAAPTDVLVISWHVQVVQNNGISPDGVHYRVVPLSPASAALEFDFLP